MSLYLDLGASHIKVLYKDTVQVFEYLTKEKVNVKDFSNFVSEDTVLHINKPVIDTFTALVHADILVTSPSSFSYCAAFLSKGTVYAKIFWHKNASFWISR